MIPTLHIGMFVFKSISYQGTCFKLYAVSKGDIHYMKNSRVINIGILVPRMLLGIGAFIASPNIKILDMAKCLGTSSSFNIIHLTEKML